MNRKGYRFSDKATMSIIIIILVVISYTGICNAGVFCVPQENEEKEHFISSKDVLPISEGDTLILSDTEPVNDPGLSKGGWSGEALTNISIGYHSFAGSSMDPSYGGVLITKIGGVIWGRKIGVELEAGWMQAEGTPPVINSDWRLARSYLQMGSVSFGINGLYSFIDRSEKNLFQPYAGIGPVVWVGWERIEADASLNMKGIFQGFNAELPGIGAYIGGCGLIGTTINITENYGLVMQFKGIISTSGPMSDLITEEEEGVYKSSIYRVVERPEFSFTGWRIECGFQW